MSFLTGTYTPHGRRSGFVLEARHESTEDTLLRQRALAPVEAAVRSHFLTLGRTVDDATVLNAASIVVRGLTTEEFFVGGEKLMDASIAPSLIKHDACGAIMDEQFWDGQNMQVRPSEKMNAEAGHG